MISILDVVKKDAQGNIYIEKFPAETHEVSSIFEDWIPSTEIINSANVSFTGVTAQATINSSVVTINSRQYRVGSVVTVTFSGGTANQTHSGTLTIGTSGSVSKVKVVPFQVRIK